MIEEDGEEGGGWWREGKEKEEKRRRRRKGGGRRSLPPSTSSLLLLFPLPSSSFFLFFFLLLPFPSFFFFWGMVLLHSPGWLQKHRNTPASALLVLCMYTGMCLDSVLCYFCHSFFIHSFFEGHLEADVIDGLLWIHAYRELGYVDIPVVGGLDSLGIYPWMIYLNHMGYWLIDCLV